MLQFVRDWRHALTIHKPDCGWDVAVPGSFNLNVVVTLSLTSLVCRMSSKRKRNAGLPCERAGC